MITLIYEMLTFTMLSLLINIKILPRDVPVVQWVHVSTAGGMSSIPGQGIKSPHAMSQTSLVAQLVKNPLAMQDTPVQFLGQEDPLEKG